jgi:hypothetical protein
VTRGRFDFQPLAEALATAGAAVEGRLSLAAADGAAVPGGTLRVHLGPRIIGGRYFRAFIEADGGVGERRFLQGLYNDGPYPGQNWIEVFDVDLPEGIDAGTDFEAALQPHLQPLAAVIPEGGHMMVEYEKPLWAETQLGLLDGIPPIATPLGALLFRLGTGDSFKDWYFPEGGQEGGRKLQGNRAYTDDQRSEMHSKRAAELHSFLERPTTRNPDRDARARRTAEGLLKELEG